MATRPATLLMCALGPRSAASHRTLDTRGFTCDTEPNTQIREGETRPWGHCQEHPGRGGRKPPKQRRRVPRGFGGNLGCLGGLRPSPSAPRV